MLRAATIQVNLLLWSELVYTYQSDFAFKPSMLREPAQASCCTLLGKQEGKEGLEEAKRLPGSLLTVAEEESPRSMTSSDRMRLPPRGYDSKQESLHQVQ